MMRAIYDGIRYPPFLLALNYEKHELEGGSVFSAVPHHGKPSDVS